jgi:hypothetical protein
MNSFWNEEELPEQWKESVILPIYKKGDKTDCDCYQSMSLSLTAYQILSNLLLDRLTSHMEEIFVAHQSEFLHNRSTTDIYSAFIRYVRKK